MRNIYQDVTDKIVTALDQGVAPWIKPWSPSGSVGIGRHHPYPVNAITRASICRCSGLKPGCRGSLRIAG